MKILKTILCILICLPVMLFSSACFSHEQDEQGFTFGAEDFICVDGEQLKTAHGAGDPIALKGVNAGGYLVTEQWMCAVSGSEKTGYLDHKTITDIFTDRFGAERTVELWECYRANYWTEEDFANCASMGMNVIRLPFTYMNVDPAYNNVARIPGQTYNFSVLEDFVRGAEKYGIYTILDLHGAYGSQNGKDHSGESLSEAEGVDFYANEEKMSKTVALWSALAEHFAGDAAVAGYDILNEPGEFAGITSERHWRFFDRLYDAIREKDEDHVVIFEACWDGKDLPSPQEYGWTNCMYSFHNYSNESDAQANLASMKLKISGVMRRGFGVPCYMGEFNCYGSEESWRLTLDLFNKQNWHWTSWTYKLNLRRTGAYPGWGIYYSYAEPVVPDTDGFDEIKSKWRALRTEAFYVDNNMTFASGTTLAALMTEYCRAETETPSDAVA